MGFIEHAKLEDADRRQELHNLKGCQVTLLTFAATATGALLGYLGTVPSAEGVALSPLVIVLPFWWCFFDKATTITRIVGYVRLLEDILLSSFMPTTFPGWENALARFRADEHDGTWLARVLGAVKSTKALKALCLATTQRYWILVYWTFFALAAACLSIGRFWVNEIGWVAFILAFVSALANYYRVAHLVDGANSYEENYKLWKEILSRSPQRAGT